MAEVPMIEPKTNRPRVWGHRGAMDFAPQNTLPSFLLAQDQGADGVELDVQLTKDGVLVVFHDNQVDALTDGRGPLSSLPWSEVKQLDAGSHFGRGWADTRIPTLEEVLSAVDHRMTVNIELKTDLPGLNVWERWLTRVLGPRKLPETQFSSFRAQCLPLAEAVARLLGSLPPNRFLISSFNPFALEAVAPLLPRVALGFLHDPTVPWNTPALMAAIPHQAWHPHHSQVTPETTAREKAAGRRIHVWTVNDPRHAVRLAEAGVDAVITNRPGEILTALS